MSKKILIFSVTVLMLLAFCQQAPAKKKKEIEAMGGLPIPGVGVSIDASYDPRLDNLAPGYRVLNVAIVNESFNMVGFNPKKDKWWIRTKSQNKRKKKYPVVWDLRGQDSATWHKIPEKARGLVGYPLVLPIGARQVVDIFVPEEIPIENFTELIIYLDSIDTTIKLTARQ